MRTKKPVPSHKKKPAPSTDKRVVSTHKIVSSSHETSSSSDDTVRAIDATNSPSIGAIPSTDDIMEAGDAPISPAEETGAPDGEIISSPDDTSVLDGAPIPSVEETSSPDIESIPLADNIVEANDAPIPSAEETNTSTAENASSTDDTMVPDDAIIPDDTMVPDDAIIPPVIETTSPEDEEIGSPIDEAASSTDDAVASDDAIITPAIETPSPTNEIVVQPIETPSPTDEIVVQPVDTALAIEPQQTWRELAEPWWKATLAILPTFLITRFIFLLLSYFGGVLFFVKNYVTTVIPFHTILYRWDWWDAKRFATIATSGYISKDYAAFFPLYPTLVHIFTSLTHLDVLASGMLISNVAFLGMLIVLYRFVTVEFDKETAQRTALYISIFPTALFFFAGYNESLFLFFTLLCFYTIRRGSWWLAGLFGLLATLTRSTGIFLALIFVCEYLQLKWPLLREAWESKQYSRAARPLAQLPIVLLIPLGIVIYSYGLYRRFGDPLAFIHAQSNWRVGLTFPLYAPLATLKKILTLPLFTFVTPHNIIDLSAAVLFTVLIVLCFIGPERIKLSQWTFPLFGLIILVTTMLYPTLPSKGGMYDPLASTQRLVLEAFVGFIILARYGRRPWFHQFYLLLSLPLLAFLTLQFMTGHWTV